MFSLGMVGRQIGLIIPKALEGTDSFSLAIPMSK